MDGEAGGFAASLVVPPTGCPAGPALVPVRKPSSGSVSVPKSGPGPGCGRLCARAGNVFRLP